MYYQPKTLRVLRAQYGYAQKTIADKLGISISQYSKIESGEKPLHIELLQKLGEVFNRTPWQLLEDIMANDGTTRGLFQDKAATEARKTPYNSKTDGEELAYFKKLAAHFEKKYMDLFSQFVEKIRGNDLEP